MKKPEHSTPDKQFEVWSGFALGETGEWVRLDRISVIIPMLLCSDAADNDYVEGYSEYCVSVLLKGYDDLHVLWRMGTDAHPKEKILEWRAEVMRAMMSLSQDPMSSNAAKRCANLADMMHRWEVENGVTKPTT